MFGKAIGFVSVVYLVQYTNGLILFDTIKEIQGATYSTNSSIIDLLIGLGEALARVEKVTIDGGKQVKQAQISIDESHDGKRINLTQQKINLVTEIMKAQANATRSGKNISACDNELENSNLPLLLLDLEFEECSVSGELTNLTADLAHIADLKGDLIRAIPTCFTKSEGKEDERFKKCVLEIIDNDKLQADNLHAQLEPVTAAAVQNAANCDERLSAEITNVINKIASNFFDCVDKS